MGFVPIYDHVQDRNRRKTYYQESSNKRSNIASYTSHSDEGIPKRTYAEVLSPQSSLATSARKNINDTLYNSDTLKIEDEEDLDWNHASFGISKETWEKSAIIEAKIKIRKNYTGLIPATIGISDKKGNRFLVQTITISKGMWLIKRNPKSHVPPLKIQQPNSDQCKTQTRIPNNDETNIKEISNSDSD
ncbi:unnamed protein product [Citrullus colocynthis]|uniref:Uncharacterized protein n=1 Tax=Citrullus colocynthis TaxID=252529 RepID=A0ABP0ZA03_9ROSI